MFVVFIRFTTYNNKLFILLLLRFNEYMYLAILLLMEIFIFLFGAIIFNAADIIINISLGTHTCIYVRYIHSYQNGL